MTFIFFTKGQNLRFTGEDLAMGNVRRIHDVRLSPPQKHLCIVGTAGEKEKESARGTNFPLPVILHALSIFRLLLFLRGCPAGYPAGSSAEERATLEPRRKLEPKSFPQLFLDFTIGRRDGSEIVASKMNLRSFGLYQDYSNSL